MEIFKYIKASTFFPTYCPTVKNWTHKMRGKDGRKNKIEFTLEDMTAIKNGIDRMCEELKFSTVG